MNTDDIVSKKVVIEPGTTSANIRNDCAPSALGDYELLESLGQGAFGKVFKAKHKSSSATFAVKLIHSQLSSDAVAIKRFEQEALAASSLTHPNLAAVFGHGRADSGAPFLVMEYLEGQSLAELLRKGGKLPAIRALNMMLELTEAMEHAHSKGVLHRDLKPGNIIVSTLHNLDNVKIVDFGLAKLLPTVRADANRITQTAEVLGSPAYMSPEQCLGNRIDVRSDIYSLGCVMYEVLVGSPPFSGDNPVQIVLKQIKEPVAQFAHSRDRMMNSLELIVRKSMQKDPEQRYQSMSALRGDLKLVQRGEKPKIKEVKSGRFLSGPLEVMTVLLLTGAALTGAALFQSWPVSFQNTAPSVNTMQAPNGQSQNATNRSICIRSTDSKVLFECEAADINQALQKACAQGKDLRNADLSWIDTQSSPLVIDHLNLENADFSGAKLVGIKFTNCNLNNAKFVSTEMVPSKFNLPSKHVNSILMSNCQLRGAVFDRADCRTQIFNDCDLGGATIKNSMMIQTYFTNCNLSDARIIATKLAGSKFDGSTLHNSEFRTSTISRDSFDKAKAKNFALHDVNYMDIVQMSDGSLGYRSYRF